MGFCSWAAVRLQDAVLVRVSVVQHVSKTRISVGFKTQKRTAGASQHLFWGGHFCHVAPKMFEVKGFDDWKESYHVVPKRLSPHKMGKHIKKNKQWRRFFPCYNILMSVNNISLSLSFRFMTPCLLTQLSGLVGIANLYAPRCLDTICHVSDTWKTFQMLSHSNQYNMVIHIITTKLGKQLEHLPKKCLTNSGSFFVPTSFQKNLKTAAPLEEDPNASAARSSWCLERPERFSWRTTGSCSVWQTFRLETCWCI